MGRSRQAGEPDGREPPAAGVRATPGRLAEDRAIGVVRATPRRARAPAGGGARRIDALPLPGMPRRGPLLAGCRWRTAAPGKARALLERRTANLPPGRGPRRTGRAPDRDHGRRCPGGPAPGHLRARGRVATLDRAGSPPAHRQGHRHPRAGQPAALEPGGNRAARFRARDLGHCSRGRPEPRRAARAAGEDPAPGRGAHQGRRIQVGVPRQHVTRAAHAAQRDPRLHPAPSRGRGGSADRAAERIPRQRPDQRPPSAAPHQRRPRPGEGRVGKARLPTGVDRSGSDDRGSMRDPAHHRR